MSKKYRTSSKPSRSMRGMNFDNPRAVENVNMFPNACKFCGRNTRKWVCYECKEYQDLAEMEDKLLASKGYQKHNDRYINSDERLQEYHLGNVQIELDDGSWIEIPKYANSVELQEKQERRERMRKAFVLRNLLQAKDCKHLNGCKFVPFSDEEDKQTCKCFGSDEEL